MKHAQTSSGYTLVELMVVATVMALVLGSVALVARSNDRAYQTGMASAHLEARVQTALDHIVRELRGAELETLNPAPQAGSPDEWLEYRRAVGFEAGEVIWSDRKLEFDFETGEIDDGIDNNGNGLVDEGRVVLTEERGTADERHLVLTRWVTRLHEGENPNGLDDNGNGLADEWGFSIERAEDDSATLILRLSLARTDAQGRLITRSAQTSTRVRN
jgi:prepilin-type N-terminal cleavage/methylation domain-containing protein